MVGLTRRLTEQRPVERRAPFCLIGIGLGAGDVAFPQIFRYGVAGDEPDENRAARRIGEGAG
jgi:hypothetical protein